MVFETTASAVGLPGPRGETLPDVRVGDGTWSITSNPLELPPNGAASLEVDHVEALAVGARQP